MDWWVDPADAAGCAEFERQAGQLFRRHAEPESDFEGARAAVAAALADLRDRGARSVTVEIDWTERSPVLIARVLEADGDEVEPTVAVPGAEGRSPRHQTPSDVVVVLPLRRRPERSFDPPRRAGSRLPLAEEADRQGAFGRESFLRALVVELATHVEVEDGPAAAEAAVAQIGANVGGRMEEEYRRARHLVGGLSPSQMADLYVRLKQAIGGDFRVVEADTERIVLASRSCPFGDVVTRAPALCRMTSSVFGGIAARNVGGASVQLVERIAVGDPECRVVVWLDEEARQRAHAHRYDRRTTQQGQVRVVLAEDRVFLRDPITHALAEASIQVVAHAPAPGELLRKVRIHQPDVAILDFREADEAEALRVAAEIRAAFPDVGVLVLAWRVDAQRAADLLRTGPQGVGYLLKHRLGDADAFVRSVLEVARGGSAIDPEIASAAASATSAELARLSVREREVLALVADGLSNQAIADRLVVTKRAVEKHVNSIFAKLGLADEPGRDRRVAATRAFLRGG